MSRAELTPLDPFDPRMDRLPKGEFILSRRDGTLWIDHADSRILISLELLDAIVRGEQSPEVSIRVRDDAGAPVPPSGYAQMRARRRSFVAPWKPFKASAAACRCVVLLS